MLEELLELVEKSVVLILVMQLLRLWRLLLLFLALLFVIVNYLHQGVHLVAGNNDDSGGGGGGKLGRRHRRRNLAVVANPDRRRRLPDAGGGTGGSDAVQSGRLSGEPPLLFSAGGGAGGGGVSPSLRMPRQTGFLTMMWLFRIHSPDLVGRRVLIFLGDGVQRFPGKSLLHLERRRVAATAPMGARNSEIILSLHLNLCRCT